MRDLKVFDRQAAATVAGGRIEKNGARDAMRLSFRGASVDKCVMEGGGIGGRHTATVDGMHGGGVRQYRVRLHGGVAGQRVRIAVRVAKLGVSRIAAGRETRARRPAVYVVLVLLGCRVNGLCDREYALGAVNDRRVQ